MPTSAAQQQQQKRQKQKQQKQKQRTTTLATRRPMSENDQHVDQHAVDSRGADESAGTRRPAGDAVLQLVRGCGGARGQNEHEHVRERK